MSYQEQYQRGIAAMKVHLEECLAGRVPPENETMAALLAWRDSHESKLRDAAQAVWDLIEQGRLVRDISGDGASDWAIKQIPVVKALADLRAELTGKS